MTIAVLAMTALAIAVIIVFRLAMKRVMEEREKMRQAELKHQQKLLHNSISTQERERQRIAADLHDELSSQLNVLKLSLYEMKPQLPELFAKTGQLLDGAIDISRYIAHDLYPPLLAQLGLTETLQDFLQPLEQQLEIDFYPNGNAKNIQPEQALHMFRISQELVQNALKYAEASRLSFILRITDNWIALRINDNGKGFDKTKIKGGLGLANVESRVQILGGKYKIKTAPGKGTGVILLVDKKPSQP